LVYRAADPLHRTAIVLRYLALLFLWRSGTIRLYTPGNG
jgi:hypothetical protein